MIPEQALDKIEQQPNDEPLENNAQQNKISQPQFQQPDINNQPIIPQMIFIPPPISDCSKYLDQLENDFLQSITKNQSSLNYITLFGEKRPINIMKKELPQPLFVDKTIKIKLKKHAKIIYQKMIENLKYCAGQMPLNYNTPLPKINEKTHQFMRLCEQLQVAQTKTAVWNLIKEETKILNKKSQQIEEFIEGMVTHCKNQQLNNF